MQAVAPRVPHKYHLLVGEGERATVHVPYEYLGRSARHSHWSGLTLSVLEIIRLGNVLWVGRIASRRLREEAMDTWQESTTLWLEGPLPVLLDRAVRAREDAHRCTLRCDV